MAADILMINSNNNNNNNDNDNDNNNDDDDDDDDDQVSTSTVHYRLFGHFARSTPLIIVLQSY